MSVDEAAQRLVAAMAQKRYMLVLAESCTAGLVADALARVSGASAVLWGSFVCYAPGAKQKMLGIDGGFLQDHGLVSAETARAMALHALDAAAAAIGGTAIAASVTGLAGPHGDGSGTPVGTVWVAVAAGGDGGFCAAKEFHFEGSRAEIRMQAAAAVLGEVQAALNLPRDLLLDK